jgi:hypothetical protein
MKPSFFALFKRGKFFHAPRPLPADLVSERHDEKTRREIKEIERFAAAAIGFCFKHDPQFKRHFLKCICAINTSHGVELDIEPADWADLLVTAPDRIYAVELKISAELRPHQDPINPAWNEGYGNFLKEEIKKGRQVRYAIVSRIQKVGDRKSGTKDGLSWRRKSWFDMARNFPETPLTMDLAQSLETLGVPPLTIRRSDNMKMTKRIRHFKEAGRLLYDTVAKLGLNQNCCRFDVYYDPSTNDGSVGIDIRRAPANRTTDNHVLLARLVTPPKKSCGWFGYLFDATGDYEMGVWFYCGNRKAAENVRDKLRSSNMVVAECKRDQTSKAIEWWNVVVRTKTHRKNSDRDWFASVFEGVGIETVI